MSSNESREHRLVELAEMLPAIIQRGQVDEHHAAVVLRDAASKKAPLLREAALQLREDPAVIAVGHAFVQNLRRGHYELALDVPPPLRVAAAFTELAVAIRARPPPGRPSPGLARRNRADHLVFVLMAAAFVFVRQSLARRSRRPRS